MTELKFSSYEELIEHLRTCHLWYSSKPEGQYDFVGITHMFLACLDNLRRHASEAELEEIGDYFEADERVFLEKVFQILQSPSN